ncbi:hypothetical protein [Saccharicrinis sp. FJH54]|uniref:hypothetical protein n=1 Tax=Saccharicrinis sp. FJH54 TaxID=3344665 RepID=UPI0035D4A6D9
MKIILAETQQLKIMNEIVEFSGDDIKPLRRFFNILWLIVLGYTAVLLLTVYDGTAVIDGALSEYIKTVEIILLLATVPAVFGWYTMKVKKIRTVEGREEKLKNYEKVWKLRALIVFIVFLFVITAYILLVDKSMAYVVAIAALVFMYCRPSVNTLKNELNDIPKL